MLIELRGAKPPLPAPGVGDRRGTAARSAAYDARMRKAVPLLLLMACASAAPARGPATSGGAQAHRAAGPNALESKLLADLADDELDHFTLLDASLIVSGVRDEAELTTARRWFET